MGIMKALTLSCIVLSFGAISLTSVDAKGTGVSKICKSYKMQDQCQQDQRCMWTPKGKCKKATQKRMQKYGGGQMGGQMGGHMGGSGHMGSDSY